MRDTLKHRIRFLDEFRGYAIIMVIATHALEYTPLNLEMKELMTFWVQAAAVPPFFLVDGYLFVDAVQRQDAFSYTGYMRKSARRLLLPWLVFTVFYGILRGYLEYTGVLQVRVILDRDFMEVLRAAYYSSISAQMYFLLSLFLIRALSFITKFVTAIRPILLVVLWVGYTVLWRTWVAMHGNESELDPMYHAAWGFQFYLLGMVLYVYRHRLDKYAWAYATAAALCLAGLKIVPVTSSFLAQYVFLLGLYFLFVALERHATILGRVGVFTMGMYLFHAPIVLKGVATVVPRFIQHSDLFQYVVVALFAVIISLILSKVWMSFRYGAIILGETPRAIAR